MRMEKCEGYEKYVRENKSANVSEHEKSVIKISPSEVIRGVFTGAVRIGGLVNIVQTTL
jgi:hypothetical protein